MIIKFNENKSAIMRLNGEELLITWTGTLPPMQRNGRVFSEAVNNYSAIISCYPPFEKV